MNGQAESGEYREWLRFARADLQSARILIEAQEGDPAAVCFHSQQASEKALKALLVFDGILVPRTHDLSVLLGMATSYAGARPVLSALDRLTRLGAGSRYPDMQIDVDLDDATRAFGVAETVLTDVARTIHERESA